MSTSVKKYIGYRGTTVEKTELAIENRLFDISTGEDEYFGFGIYFFEDDRDEAFRFAQYVRKIPKENIGIITASIEVESQKIFDLMMSSVYEDYINTVEVLGNRLAREGKKPKKNQTFDCRFINAICGKEGYSLVRGPYNPNHSKAFNLRQKSFTRIPKIHIQLCVIDASIISHVC